MKIFDSVPIPKTKYSHFDLSHDVKLSFKMGDLIPILTQECLPGDRFQMSTDALIRMAPMVAPPMHKVDIYIHYFFVPNRILWENWEKFIAPEKDDSVPPAFPVISDFGGGETLFDIGSLGDYLGLPTGQTLGILGSEELSAIPFAAYQKIYNDWYRDQNSIDEVYDTLENGPQDPADLPSLKALRKRAWEHDYFTSCLPEPQKGPDVLIPGTINFTGSTATVDYVPTGNQFTIYNALGSALYPNAELGSDNVNAKLVDVNNPTQGLNIDPGDNYQVDLSTATATLDATVEDLRTAAAIQRFLERSARVGTRYIEVIRGHFGVNSSDKRMQRPEYLGGTKSTMAMSEVLQTGETASTPQGNMAGHGLSVAQGNGVTYFCEEHGYLMGIMSVLPKTAYQQGVPKHFFKTKDRYQYYWPDLANIGEEPVYNWELYFDENDIAYTTGVFGYIPRYSEYRYQGGRVSGEFRDTLNFWHMGRIFGTQPNLNESFISSDPTNRIFAVTGAPVDHLYAHCYHRIDARRPLPKYGTPGSII